MLPPSRRFIVLDTAVYSIEVLRPVVERIRRHDRDLGDQLRRALSSVALNIAEGNANEGGLRFSRFSTAAGSNSESRTALRVAVAWGYVAASDVAAGDRLLDSVGAMLHRAGVTLAFGLATLGRMGQWFPKPTAKEWRELVELVLFVLVQLPPW